MNAHQLIETRVFEADFADLIGVEPEAVEITLYAERGDGTICHLISIDGDVRRAVDKWFASGGRAGLKAAGTRISSPQFYEERNITRLSMENADTDRKEERLREKGIGPMRVRLEIF